VATSLYKGFAQAKEYFCERLFAQIPEALFFGGEYFEITRDIFGEDPFPYGIKANAAMLETITTYSFEQGLTPRKMKIEELFAESTLDS
jgi:4,5-dihydroxyphthalate decarboxylase